MITSIKPVIWLAYVSCPFTTAVYFERALRKVATVVTCGPKITPRIIEGWNLKNLNLPVVDLDIPLTATPDMEQVLNASKGRVPDPDLYLWIESVPGYHPSKLEKVTCPKACYFIDSHLNLEHHLRWATQFDHVFVAQREYVEAFRKAGIRSVHWLPLACDPEVHSKKTESKHFDIGFVGTVTQGTRRHHLLQELAKNRFLVEPKRCFWDEMALHISRSRIAFNNAIRNDLNMRVFEAMSMGSFLLTDQAENSGQEELFQAGEDLGVYQDSTLVDNCRRWLILEEEREAIAARGQQLVHQAHTYAHRCEDLLAVCLNGKSTTYSAAELREKSLSGLESIPRIFPAEPKTPRGRSFIIPVLDGDSDPSEGFHKLLEDLKDVEGEVIAIFNSAEAEKAYRNHPRVTYSATLNVNVGVARAWNIGTHIATQPTLFFFNADLRIRHQSIDVLQQALWDLPQAAVVGPQGSFFQFSSYSDLFYFDKGKARKPVPVDAISGFLFAAKRELFSKKLLQFENAYTPCFNEEWDLGLQARQAGLKCYVVPVTDYDHEWGISSNPHKLVRYYGTEVQPAREILARNRIFFWRKWLSIDEELRAAQENPSSHPPNFLQTTMTP